MTANNVTYFYILRTLQEPYIDPTNLGSGRSNLNSNQANHEPNFKNLKVLDVGCGVGTLSLYLASLGAQVTGIDISPRAISLANQAKNSVGFNDAARRKTEFRGGSVEFQINELKKVVKKSPKFHNAFDLVICTEVIEHIPDDDAFLDDLVSCLKPGGRLFLTTPSSENLLYRLGFYKGFDLDVGHLRRYTPDSIAAKCRQHNLKIEKVVTVEGPLRNIFYTTKLGILLKLVRGPLVPIFHWFDQISAAIFGAADIQILAVKSATKKPMQTKPISTKKSAKNSLKK